MPVEEIQGGNRIRGCHTVPDQQATDQVSGLPAVLIEMSPEERELYVEEMQFRREELRQQIQDVSRHRRRYVSEQMKVRGLDDSLAFDAVVRRRIREQLEEKGWVPPED